MKFNAFTVGFFIMMLATPCLKYFFPAWSTFKILAVAHLFYVPIIIAAIVEVNRSKRIDRKEKTKWTLAFIFVTFFTSLYYILAERKNVVPTQESL